MLANSQKIDEVIQKELTDIKTKYGDERKTKVIAGAAKIISVEDLVPEEETMLILTQGGYVKRMKNTEYKTQKRGGSGIKTMNVTAKTGPVIAARVISKDEGVGEDEIVVISKKGQVIRTELVQIPSLSRSTQGVRIMKLRDKDAIASFVCL